MVIGESVREESQLLGLQVVDDVTVVLGESSEVVKVGLLSEDEFL